MDSVIDNVVCMTFSFPAMLVFIGVYYGVRNHWRKEEEDTRLMYKFVENIIGKELYLNSKTPMF